MTAVEIVALAGGILALIVSVCTIVTFVINRKKEGYERGFDYGGICEDIKYIRNSCDDTRLDIKDVNRKLDQQNERLIRVEEGQKSDRKRIEVLERKIDAKGDD